MSESQMSAPDPPSSLESMLEAALEPLLGRVEVSELFRMTGGASRETWRFDATTVDGDRHDLVLRRDPPGRASAPGAIAREAAAMRGAAAAGVAVPEVLVHVDEPETWGGAGMVMRRISGETIARRILRDERFGAARPVLTQQCATALAGVHSLAPGTLGDVTPVDPVDSLRQIYDGLGQLVPAFEAAFAWLGSRRPDPTRTSVVHGDFRLGNLMVDETGLAAVLDWELVHLGDPVEDLGWLCVRAWRFGAPAPVGGLGTRDELLEAYRSAGGDRIDTETLLWWEVYGTLRWGVICLLQTSVHLNGELRSVELAAIGRRVCETEWDLLLLLAGDHADAARAVAAERASFEERAPAAAGLHGRPTSVELVQAVREFLSEHVMAGTSGSLAFGARVAANVLGTVERELRSGAAQTARRQVALAAIGMAGETEFARAIRSGALALGDDPVLSVLAEGVVDRVLVANPRYLGDQS